MKILLTGASGKLGQELLKRKWKDIEFITPSHKDMDITKAIRKYKVQAVIHAAAYTNVSKAEKDKKTCYNVNVDGTFNLLQIYRCPFIYISSEYAFAPVNYYSYTKSLAECFVMLHARKYLIIRTLFKPNPYPYDRAPIDQFTQGDYVDVIAPLIKRRIIRWLNDKHSESRLMYIGTGRKSIYDLAKRTKKVKKCTLEEIARDTHTEYPYDYV